MTAFGSPDSPFAPATFFARAATRLDASPEPADAGRDGDHTLNPGFVYDEGDYRDAAVLIPVVAREPEVSLILTERTTHLSAHAGQIAFPGGKIDPTDAGPAEAAIREAHEEIGLLPGLIEPIGYLRAYYTRTGYRIVPVIGKVDPQHILTINPNEVQSAFEVPLAFLMDPQNHHQGSREFRGTIRHFYEMPYEGRYIWGITAGIIRGLYERIFV